MRFRRNSVGASVGASLVGALELGAPTRRSAHKGRPYILFWGLHCGDRLAGSGNHIAHKMGGEAGMDGQNANKISYGNLAYHFGSGTHDAMLLRKCF